MIYADRDIFSQVDVHYHGYHWLSLHHKMCDELARMEQKYTAVCRRKVGLDYSHLYEVCFAIRTKHDVGPGLSQSILLIRISHSSQLTQQVRLMWDYMELRVHV